MDASKNKRHLTAKNGRQMSLILVLTVATFWHEFACRYVFGLSPVLYLNAVTYNGDIDVNAGSFICFCPARGWLSGWLSRVWQSLVVEGWPDFHDAGLQVYMCSPCGRVVQLRQPRIWCCHYLPPGSLITLGASESLSYSHVSFNLI